MKEFQGRHRRSRLITSRLVQALLVLVLFLVGQSVFRLYGRERTVVGEATSIQQELASLQVRRAELLAEIARLETDRGVEEEIRTRFGVVKAGERVINLVGTPATATPIVSPPWWRKVFNWIASIV